jgi:hypothetical protein
MVAPTKFLLSGDNTIPSDLAYSASVPVWYQALDGSSGAVLGAALIADLESVGWVHTATLSPGATLQATSPQTALALTVLLDITWTAGQVTMQFHGTATGVLLGLKCAAGRVYQIVCGACQFFISQVNTPGPDANGSNIAGGIPYIAPNDPAYSDGAMPDEIWWMIGDGAPYGSETWRNNLGLTSWSTGWSAYFHRPTESTAHSLVQGTQSVPLHCVDFWASGATATMQYANTEPFLFEPLVAWGDYCAAGYPFTGYPPKVRGQLWDAFCMSGPPVGASEGPVGTDLEIELFGQGTYWVNFTLDAGLAALYLLVASQSMPGNLAY